MLKINSLVFPTSIYFQIWEEFVIYIYIYIYRVWWINWHNFKSLISCMRFVYFRFCLLCSKLEPVVHCLWGKQHRNASELPPEIWKQHAIHWMIYNENFIVLECQFQDSAGYLKTWKSAWMITMVRHLECLTLIFLIDRNEFGGEI